eukprot:scaffold5042_cov81-Cylindrotheca_fusiformis.AAC.3
MPSKSRDPLLDSQNNSEATVAESHRCADADLFRQVEGPRPSRQAIPFSMKLERLGQVQLMMQ